MASAAAVLRCGVAVEVNGRPIHRAKGAKDVGLQVLPTARGLGQLRVVGFRRELAFCASSLRYLAIGRAMLQTLDAETQRKFQGGQVSIALTGFGGHKLETASTASLSPRREANFRLALSDRLAEGALSFVGSDGTQIAVTNAQPAHLTLVLQCFGLGSRGNCGGSGMDVGAPPAKRQRVGERNGVDAAVSHNRRTPLKAAGGAATPAAHASANTPAQVVAVESVVSSPPAGAMADAETPPTNAETSAREACSLTDLPPNLLTDVLETARPDDACIRLLAQACRDLRDFVLSRRQRSLSLSTKHSVPVDRVIEAVARRNALRVLNLSGYAALTCNAAAKLSKVIAGESAPGSGAGVGVRLQALLLRGCKALSDVAVRKLLVACPELEFLDILEIPRLTNQASMAQAAQGVACLPAFAAWPLARLGAAAALAAQLPRRRAAARGRLAMCGPRLTAPSHGDAAFATIPRLCEIHRACGLLPAAGAGVAAAPPALTHLVLSNCAELRNFPRFTESLVHLDLQGSALRFDASAAAGQAWRPLSGCPRLQSLSLAGCSMLTAQGLLACLMSIPAAARLSALDLSDTRADAEVFAALVRLECLGKLTHLRLAGCPLRDGALLAIFRARTSLEVLDVSSCTYLESLFVGMSRAELTALPLPKLRILSLGNTPVGSQLEAARAAAALCAPQASLVRSPLDIFAGYSTLPAVLLKVRRGRNGGAGELVHMQSGGPPLIVLLCSAPVATSLCTSPPVTAGTSMWV
eukprot:CAMPEP_0170253308 /NCGR_PEP_ID=MMETSP0116_2-20130129/26493_1 /TAXON_ID=400756 /ORGANISM="Durinskia baltica, Strain CSIRO CS-38" /LENGTH=754 /DNA_ID=CAMNT_0010504289 /DNA_START=1 /DNA_END=2265 /DNA_ORIENTATION=+